MHSGPGAAGPGRKMSPAPDTTRDMSQTPPPEAGATRRRPAVTGTATPPAQPQQGQPQQPHPQQPHPQQGQPTQPRPQQPLPSQAHGRPRGARAQPPRADGPGPDAAVLPMLPRFGRPPGVRRPLPDAVAVRRLEIPDSAPPYDDELGVTMRPGRVPQGAGPGQLPRAAPVTEAGSADRGPDAEPPGEPETPEQARTAREREVARDGDQVAAARWPGQFAQVLAETLAGSRPPRQITPWTTEEARRHIRQLGPLLAARHRPQVRRVVTSSPAADVVEMTAVVTFGQTVRALAVRLERNAAQAPRPGREARPARWLCTAVEAA